MKKTIITLFSVMAAMTSIAQTYNMEITLSDGTKQIIPADKVSEVHFVEASGEEEDNYNILSEEYIPDGALRAAIAEQVAGGGDILTVEQASKYAGALVLDTPYVQTFKGIEYLTSLTSLIANGVFANSLDVSMMHNLAELSINRSNVSNLNLGTPENLRSLDISSSALKNYDLSILPDEMQVIMVDALDYTNLDFRRFSEIETISCTQNKLTELQVDGLARLKKIIFSTNLLSEVSFSGCTELADVVGTFNMDLSEVDLTGCKSIRTFMFMNTSLKSFDPSPFTATLEELNLGWTQLSSLNLSGCDKLTYLAVNNTNLTEVLDFSACVNLDELRVEATSIPEIDLSCCADLSVLQCYENPALKTLRMADHLTKLFQLNVDNCPLLETFEWGSTEKLQYANIYMTPLKRIDLSRINKDYSNIYLEYNDDLEEIKVWEGFDIDNPPTNIQKPDYTKFVYEFSGEK